MTDDQAVPLPPGAGQPPQSRAAEAANPHFSDWWDGVSEPVGAALVRAAEHLDDPFAESIASVGCDVAHEAFCAGWEAAVNDARNRSVLVRQAYETGRAEGGRQAAPPPVAINAATQALTRRMSAGELLSNRDIARAALAAAADVLRAQGAATEREECAQLVTSDAAVAAAAEASDEWFGKDGDLKCGASELSKAQARVELAVVADLIRARTTP